MTRSLNRWLGSWLMRKRSKLPKKRHVLIAVCDHYEPFHRADKATALSRVALWQRELLKITAMYSGSDGVPPRHTFFYPIEQWDADVCKALAQLCHTSGSEAEIHLHHDNDTADNLRTTLIEGKERFAQLGLLSCDNKGDVRYGFIHGNWALDNSHPDGRHCGISNELDILRETGCYADFTLPSAPSPCQINKINALYYAREDGLPCSHASGGIVSVGGGHQDGELLMVQGPLGLNWGRRKWGILPRIENADITTANPPTMHRLALWQKCHIHVAGRPEWIFIKLHTHGAIERNSSMLLGEPMRQFHKQLAELSRCDANFQYHYVTAREMVNILHAAEAGETENPASYRNYRYKRSLSTG
jgi:hypothetical protein